MGFKDFILSYVGFIHLIAAIIATILGTFIILIKKGTTSHKIIGLFYVVFMLIVLTTVFMIYKLFGTWGVFHWMAVVSVLTILGGMLPIFLRYPKKSYISLHFSFMYWSIIGLYGSFLAESLVRIPKVAIESGVPNGLFYISSGLGGILVTSIGFYYFYKMKPKWKGQFEIK